MRGESRADQQGVGSEERIVLQQMEARTLKKGNREIHCLRYRLLLGNSFDQEWGLSMPYFICCECFESKTESLHEF